jgi:hypothetical protein
MEAAANSIPIINKIVDPGEVQLKILDVLTSLQETLQKTGQGKKIGGESSNVKYAPPKKSGLFEGENTGKISEAFKKELFKLSLGPSRILVEEFEKFTKVDIQKSIEKSFNRLSGIVKKTKLRETTNPSKNDLSKNEFGQAILYQLNEELKRDKEKEKSPFAKLLGNLGTGFLSAFGIGAGVKVLPNLGRNIAGRAINKETGKFVSEALFKKVAQQGAGQAIGRSFALAGGIASIATGLIMMVIDGIKGSLLSGKWGTTKIGSAVGAAFAGTGKGIINAFGNMGKWALIGAGIGFLIPPGNIVGAIAGGLIGAALGGILGFIGGKNLAKGFDSLGKWFSQKLEVFQKGFQKLIAENPVFRILFKGAKAVFDFMFSPLINAWTEVFKSFGEIFNVWTKGKGTFAQKLGKSVLFLFEGIFRGIGKFVIGSALALPKLLSTVFSDILPDIRKSFNAKEIGKSLVVFLGQFVQGALSAGAEGLKGLSIFGNAILQFFQPFVTYFEYLGDSFKKGGIGGLLSAVGSGVSSKGFETFRETKKKKAIESAELEYKSGLSLLNPKSATYAQDKIYLESQRKAKLTEAEGFASGGIISKQGYYLGAEGNRPEAVIPLAKGSKGFDNKAVQELLSNANTKNKNGENEIVTAIKELTNIMKNKDFNNIIQNNQSSQFSFDKLRMSLSYNKGA